MPPTYTVGVYAPRVALSIALIALLAAAGGCAATQEAGKPFPADARRQLRLDRTTPRDAEKLLGTPVTKTTDPSGGERWTYEHTRVSATRAVPFGRRVTVRQTPYRQLVLTFQSGVLRDCLYVSERYRTEGELIVADGSVRESCGRP
jgi:hypothetical protein